MPSSMMAALSNRNGSILLWHKSGGDGTNSITRSSKLIYGKIENDLIKIFIYCVRWENGG